MWIQRAHGCRESAGTVRVFSITGIDIHYVRIVP
nr:MAG TPA: hypothetical protein [Herelleviridae sp.]